MMHPYNSWQLKQIADNMESYRIKKLWHYEVASSVVKEARRSLFAILYDEDQCELVLSDWSYKNGIEQRRKWLPQMRLQEKE
jgi:hypothetical protein